MPLKRREDWKYDTWRPSKIEKFTQAMWEVLQDWLNAIILTDEELFLLANDKLNEEERICYATFKTYKASEIQDEKAIYSDFLALYKKALLKQKQNLFRKLEWESKEWDKYQNQWQKYAWIIERKFDDWNLRNIWENHNKNSWEIVFKIKS